MSHIALSRVMVRMLYDPTFTERVLAEPQALDGIALTAAEREWLRRPDPRAWRTDPERIDRSMQALLQQYPVGLALSVRATGQRDPFRPFLRTERFHRAIQERGSLALAFADHLVERAEAETWSDPRIVPVLRLERAIVDVHRHAPPRPVRGGPGATHYRLSPDKRLHRAERGTADLHEAVHQALAGSGKELAATVLDLLPRLPDRAIARGRTEPLLLELARNDGPRVQFAVGAAEITPALFDLLSYAQSPRTPAALVARVRDLGASAHEAPDVIAGLIEEETLLPGR